MWIFGYGSLMWKTGFHAVDRRVGWIEGWRRRFHQGSHDHRGTPDAPGLVATLEPDEDAVCWGVAWRVDPEEADVVRARLDHRERNGYARHEVTVHVPRQPAPGERPDRGEDGPQPEDVESIPRVLVYVATPDNHAWHGPDDPDAMAARIARSEGHSGHNAEYLFGVEAELRELGVREPHVEDLAERVRRLLGREAGDRAGEW